VLYQAELLPDRRSRAKELGTRGEAEAAL